MPNTELRTLFGSLSDDELTERAASGGLTDEAQGLAEAELSSRGQPLPARRTEPLAEPMPYQGDMTTVAKDLSATEAHLLRACLRAGGIPAEAADTNLVQTHSLLAIAMGGASVRVPADCVEDARAAIAAYERGDFALGDDFDAGEITG